MFQGRPGLPPPPPRPALRQVLSLPGYSTSQVSFLMVLVLVMMELVLMQVLERVLGLLVMSAMLLKIFLV